MLSPSDMNLLAKTRLKDAASLLSEGRYDATAYICGYALEIALKARIVKTLKWTGFPDNHKEFGGLLSFKSHDLNILLRLSGWQPKVLNKYGAEWTVVRNWNPELRYQPPGFTSKIQAESMVESTKLLVGALL